MVEEIFQRQLELKIKRERERGRKKRGEAAIGIKMKREFNYTLGFLETPLPLLFRGGKISAGGRGTGDGGNPC